MMKMLFNLTEVSCSEFKKEISIWQEKRFIEKLDYLSILNILVSVHSLEVEFC